MIGGGVYRLARDLVKYNRMLRALAAREVAGMYAGSLLRFCWTFIQQAVMILVFWFVFSVVRDGVQFSKNALCVAAADAIFSDGDNRYRSFAISS
jgi:ABC-type polysaccharide/polyol phosphate export permease